MTLTLKEFTPNQPLLAVFSNWEGGWVGPDPNWKIPINMYFLFLNHSLRMLIFGMLYNINPTGRNMKKQAGPELCQAQAELG